MPSGFLPPVVGVSAPSPMFFWALHPGVPAFTGYHMLDVARLGALRHWPPSPLHHTHPTAVLSAPRTAHMKKKKSHLSTPLLQWDGIPHSISQWFLEHIYTGLALGSPLLGPHNSTYHTPWHTLWPVPYLCVGALQAPKRTKFHKTSHTSRFLSSCSCCRPRKGQKKRQKYGAKRQGKEEGRGSILRSCSQRMLLIALKWSQQFKNKLWT